VWAGLQIHRKIQGEERKIYWDAVLRNTENRAMAKGIETRKHKPGKDEEAQSMGMPWVEESKNSFCGKRKEEVVRFESRNYMGRIGKSQRFS